VIVVPAAAAREHPEMAAQNGVQWFKQIGAQAAAAMVVDARSANDAALVAAIESATLDLSAAAAIRSCWSKPCALASLAGDRESARARRLTRRGQRRRDGAGQHDVESAHGRPDRTAWNLIPIVTLPHFRADRIDGARALRGQLAGATRLFGIAERNLRDLRRIEMERLGTGSGWLKCWQMV